MMFDDPTMPGDDTTDEASDDTSAAPMPAGTDIPEGAEGSDDAS